MIGRATLFTASAALATFVVDQGSKAVAERTLAEGQVVHGPWGVRVRRSRNEDPLAAHPLAAAAIIAGGAALALGVATTGTLLRRPVLVQIGSGMVAGAMAGNLIDRARHGGVTDFLPSPVGVVNLADVALGAGIVLAGVGLVLR